MFCIKNCQKGKNIPKKNEHANPKFCVFSYLISQGLLVVFIKDEAIIKVISRHVVLSLYTALYLISHHPSQTVSLEKAQGKRSALTALKHVKTKTLCNDNKKLFELK